MLAFSIKTKIAKIFSFITCSSVVLRNLNWDVPYRFHQIFVRDKTNFSIPASKAAPTKPAIVLEKFTTAPYRPHNVGLDADANLDSTEIRIMSAWTKASVVRVTLYNKITNLKLWKISRGLCYITAQGSVNWKNYDHRQ